MEPGSHLYGYYGQTANSLCNYASSWKSQVARVKLQSVHILSFFDWSNDYKYIHIPSEMVSYADNIIGYVEKWLNKKSKKFKDTLPELDSESQHLFTELWKGNRSEHEPDSMWVISITLAQQLPAWQTSKVPMR